MDNSDHLMVPAKERSLRRVRDIREGLSGPDSEYHTQRALIRMADLCNDQRQFGWFRHEAEECLAIKRLLTAAGIREMALIPRPERRNG